MPWRALSALVPGVLGIAVASVVDSAGLAAVSVADIVAVLSDNAARGRSLVAARRCSVRTAPRRISSRPSQTISTSGSLPCGSASANRPR